VTGVVETRFAKSDGGDHIAYQVVGDGRVDVLVTRTAMFPIDLMWDEPRLAHFLNRMSSFSRHIWFDQRSTGASDSLDHAESRLTESVFEDMVTVLDEIGCERVTVLGFNVPVGLFFAATHPERTTALILINTTARVRRDDDYPQGLPDDEVALAIERASQGVTGSGMGSFALSLDDDARFQRWM